MIVEDVHAKFVENHIKIEVIIDVMIVE